MQPNRYLSIQALRLVAAVLVVVVHAAYYTRDRFDEDAADLAWLGGYGVWLFFAISGFVMAVTTDPARLTGPVPDWRAFGLRRVARVVPLYWLMTSIKIAVILTAGGFVVNAALDPSAVVRSFLLVPSVNEAGQIHPIWAVGWTLVFEMAFYAVVMLALAARLDPLRVCAPVMLGVAVLSIWRPADGSALWFYADPVTLYFVAGMVVARWAETRPAVACAALALLATVTGAIRSVSDPAAAIPAAITFLGLSAVVFTAVRTEGRVHRRIPRWLVTGGAASYSLYLTHPLFAPIVPELAARIAPAAPWMVVAVATTAVVVAIAPLVFRYVETPMSAIVLRSTSRVRARWSAPRGRHARRTAAEVQPTS